MIEIPGRIPIRIHPIFWLLVVLISIINTPILSSFDTSSVLETLTWAAVIIISLLIHEYGHAFTARIFGQEAQIDLMGMGGLDISLWALFEKVARFSDCSQWAFSRYRSLFSCLSSTQYLASS